MVADPVKTDSNLMEILEILGIVVACLSAFIVIVLVAKRAVSKSKSNRVGSANDKKKNEIELSHYVKEKQNAESFMRLVRSKDGSVVYEDIYV